ncbi:MAG: trypsin-like peptidase domain-containing protein [Chloroflexi bacterium]|nr:trypsin-like peptidase domain-containing protein [Chloroflexota bacterium]
MNNFILQLNDDLAANVEHARRSLVEIRNGHGGAGAGIIVRSDGLIITNAHVIGRRGLRATLPDGQTLPARLIAYDREHDLAALAVDATNLPAIELGDSKNLQPGQWVMSVGHPWGVAGAVTAGIVIGSGAEFPEFNTGGREFIVASLHMRPGHSGGPMLNSEGKLIGVNTMINGPDVGMAIPVHVLKAFLKELGDVQAARQPQHAESMMV